MVDADCSEPRHFVALTGLTLTVVAHQWLFDLARVAGSVLGERVDHALVDDLERVAKARRRMDDAIGGGTPAPSRPGRLAPGGGDAGQRRLHRGRG